MKLFEPSYNSAVSGAQRAVSSFSSLCCNVQEVMIDMDYNLGGVQISAACPASGDKTRTLPLPPSSGVP